MELVHSNSPLTALAEKIANHITEYDGQTLCLLAGGSALRLALHFSDKNIKRRTIFMMGDERASEGIEENNFLQLRTLLRGNLQQLELVDTGFHADETVDSYADRLSQKISDLQTVMDSPQIISVHGIGEDGHTSGIFPMSEDVFSETYGGDSTYVPVILESLRIDSRASLTPQWILDNVDFMFGYAVGQSKENVLKKLISEELSLNQMPAQILKKHSNAKLYTDIQIDT